MLQLRWRKTRALASFLSWCLYAPRFAHENWRMVPHSCSSIQIKRSRSYFDLISTSIFSNAWYKLFAQSRSKLPAIGNDPYILRDTYHVPNHDTEGPNRAPSVVTECVRHFCIISFQPKFLWIQRFISCRYCACERDLRWDPSKQVPHNLDSSACSATLQSEYQPTMTHTSQDFRPRGLLVSTEAVSTRR